MAMVSWPATIPCMLMLVPIMMLLASIWMRALLTRMMVRLGTTISTRGCQAQPLPTPMVIKVQPVAVISMWMSWWVLMPVMWIPAQPFLRTLPAWFFRPAVLTANTARIFSLALRNCTSFRTVTRPNRLSRTRNTALPRITPIFLMRAVFIKPVTLTQTLRLLLVPSG